MKYYVWSGLSSATKPITNVSIGALALESDTGSGYQWTGSFWQQDSTAGQVHFVPVSDPNGNYPANNFTDINPAATTAAAAFTITGLQGMHSGQFSFTLTTETILLEALDSSGNNLGPILVEHINVAGIPSGTIASASVLVTGAYKIKSPFIGASLRCTKSAAVQTLTFYGFMSGAS